MLLALRAATVLTSLADAAQWHARSAFHGVSPGLWLHHVVDPEHHQVEVAAGTLCARETELPRLHERRCVVRQ
jgi:hypothetical protein